jgi:pimeloyl-ACP methyl ester carboxylesterase
METRTIETKRGLEIRVHEAGKGAPLLFLHGAGGIFQENPFLDELAKRYHVLAPEWPGYGESKGEEKIEDMLDFTLHAWDVAEALGLEKPHVVGHSMGGMIAAEMACVAPNDLAKLVLIGPAGLWLDEHPIPDLYSLFPVELAPLLSHDPAVATRLLVGDKGLDFNDFEVLKAFLVVNARQMGTAAKILFPIPDRQLAKRLYRLKAPTRIIWGAEDRLIVPAYAKRWLELVPAADLVAIPEAGHLLPYERPAELVAAVRSFLG